MSYCLNPTCSHPQNPDGALVCQACGSRLLLRDRYYVRKTLGQGGFGATYLAIDTGLPGKPACVIKQLRPSNTSPGFLAMAGELFEREAQSLGKLGGHPQVPRLLDYFEDRQQFYLVQEFIGGRNLQQEVKQNGPFTEAGVRQFLSEIVPILDHIHANQMIHRDIKPANIIRRDIDKKLVLIDFGAVKNKVNPTAANDPDQTTLTQFAVGTPGFAPPEQLAMRPVYASDIYSLGITCIYLLTARSPKDLKHNPSTGSLEWHNHITVSPHLEQVLEKMIEAAVRDRYQSASDILRALEMEPYLDSLAEGLISKPSPSAARSNNRTARPTWERPSPVEPTPSPGGRASSNSSRNANISQLAESIRERRRQKGLPTSRDVGGGGYMAPATGGLADTAAGGYSRPTGGQASANSIGARKPSSKPVVKKLDAKGLLEAYASGRRDFTKHDLRHLDLQQAELPQTILVSANLTGTNFRKAELTQADFGKAILKQANLREAKLTSAYFSGANLEEADLRGAELCLANLEKTNLKGANLCGANLANAKVTEEQLKSAKTNWKTILPNGKQARW